MLATQRITGDKWISIRNSGVLQVTREEVHASVPNIMRHNTRFRLGVRAINGAGMASCANPTICAREGISAAEASQKLAADLGELLGTGEEEVREGTTELLLEAAAEWRR